MQAVQKEYWKNNKEGKSVKIHIKIYAMDAQPAIMVPTHEGLGNTGMVAVVPENGPDGAISRDTGAI